MNSTDALLKKPEGLAMIDIEAEKKAEAPEVYVFVCVQRNITDGTPWYKLVGDPETGEPYPAFPSLEDAQVFLKTVGADRCGIIQMEVAY